MEFININQETACSGRSSKDKESQRRIRTHVMRRYRRHQRDGYRASPESRTLNESKSDVDMQHAEPPISLDASALTYSAPSKAAVSLVSRNDVSSGFSTGCKATKKPRRPRAAKPDHSNDLAIRECLSNAGSSSYILVPRGLPQWPSRTIDSTYSPIELQQIIAMAIQYYKWNVPALTSEQAFATLNTIAHSQQAPSHVLFDQSLCNVDLLASNDTLRLHFASVCLASISSTCSRPNAPILGTYEKFKADVLRGLRANLKQSAIATTRSCLGAMIGLTLFEITLGSCEALLHLRGIADILRLHGGIQYQSYGGGIRKHAEFIDLLYAVRTGTEPIYTTSLVASLEDVEAMKAGISNVDITELVRETKIPSIAWQWAQRDMDTSAQGSRSELRGSTRLLRNYFSSDLLEDPVLLPLVVDSSASLNDGQADGDDVTSHANHEIMVQRWQKYLLDLATSETSADDVAFACRSAAELLDNADQTGGAIFSACICSMKESRWTSMPSAYFRILLIALVNTNDQTQQAQLISELNRQVYRLKLYDWLVIKMVILEFISIRSHLNGNSNEKVE